MTDASLPTGVLFCPPCDSDMPDEQAFPLLTNFESDDPSAFSALLAEAAKARVPVRVFTRAYGYDESTGEHFPLGPGIGALHLNAAALAPGDSIEAAIGRMAALWTSPA